MLARPYSRLAATYDRALGWASFVRTRRAFEVLARQYGIRFKTAADLGCGTGLFACYLRRRWGVPVFAVDRSPEMLNVARCNCSEPGIRWLQQDLRCLRLPCRVDLATSNFDTLNHVLSPCGVRRVFRRVWRCLQPGGYFIFDLVTPRLPRGGLKAYFSRFHSLGPLLVRRIRWDPRANLLTILILHRTPPSPPFARGGETELEVHRERAYSPVDAARWLRRTGFLVRGVHDAETLRLPRECPERVIFVAQKPDCGWNDIQRK
jgi:SAM-dependent methyltransferase